VITAASFVFVIAGFALAALWVCAGMVLYQIHRDHHKSMRRFRDTSRKAVGRDRSKL
jgi:hypothetical protein